MKGNFAMEMDKRRFGERVRIRRRELKITQADLATRLLGDGQVRNDVLTAETEDIAAVLRYPKRNPTADAFENRQVGRCRLRIRIPPVNYCNTLRTVRIRLERQIVI